MSLSEFWSDQIKNNIPADPFYAQLDAHIICHTVDGRFDRAEWVGGTQAGISFALADGDVAIDERLGRMQIGDLTLRIIERNEPYQLYIVERME